MPTNADVVIKIRETEVDVVTSINGNKSIDKYQLSSPESAEFLARVMVVLGDSANAARATARNQ